MAITKKHPSSPRRQDLHDERETSPLPTLSEALIIAVAALVALVALYEIHDSLDRVGQVVTSGAAFRSASSSPPLAQASRHANAAGESTWQWSGPLAGMR